MAGVFSPLIVSFEEQKGLILMKCSLSTFHLCPHGDLKTALLRYKPTVHPFKAYNSIVLANPQICATFAVNFRTFSLLQEETLRPLTTSLLLVHAHLQP